MGVKLQQTIERQIKIGSDINDIVNDIHETEQTWENNIERVQADLVMAELNSHEI